MTDRRDLRIVTLWDLGNVLRLEPWGPKTLNSVGRVLVARGAKGYPEAAEGNSGIGYLVLARSRGSPQ